MCFAFTYGFCVAYVGAGGGVTLQAAKWLVIFVGEDFVELLVFLRARVAAFTTFLALSSHCSDAENIVF